MSSRVQMHILTYGCFYTLVSIQALEGSVKREM